MVSDFTCPNSAQTEAIAALKLCSFWKGGKFRFNAFSISGTPGSGFMAEQGLEIRLMLSVVAWLRNLCGRARHRL
jgi:hypothetical protein